MNAPLNKSLKKCLNAVDFYYLSMQTYCALYYTGQKIASYTGPHFMIASNSSAIFGHNLASCILSSWLFLNNVFGMLLHLFHSIKTNIWYLSFALKFKSKKYFKLTMQTRLEIYKTMKKSFKISISTDKYWKTGSLSREAEKSL